jgi:hypothetical protein
MSGVEMIKPFGGGDSFDGHQRILSERSVGPVRQDRFRAHAGGKANENLGSILDVVPRDENAPWPRRAPCRGGYDFAAGRACRTGSLLSDQTRAPHMWFERERSREN